MERGGRAWESWLFCGLSGVRLPTLITALHPCSFVLPAGCKLGVYLGDDLGQIFSLVCFGLSSTLFGTLIWSCRLSDSQTFNQFTKISADDLFVFSILMDIFIPYISLSTSQQGLGRKGRQIHMLCQPCTYRLQKYFIQSGAPGWLSR